MREIYLGTECRGLSWRFPRSEDIHTYYGDAYVLHGLSPQSRGGAILGLLGRNGVGKTTLVKSVVGFNPPRGDASSSRVWMSRGSPRSKRGAMAMALLPQGRRVFPSLTVE